MITFENIKNNEYINLLVNEADKVLWKIEFTEHSKVHVMKCVDVASKILKNLNYSNREIELCKIAAYMHDIGNVVNRKNHAQSGAILAYDVLKNMNMELSDILEVVKAIGHHDDSSAAPVSAISAALIIADKTDVRRSRVREDALDDFDDIHNRVNYAAKESKVVIKLDDKDDKKGEIDLIIKIDTTVCPVIEYFQIFLERMNLCKKAANYLNMNFRLIINDSILM